MQRSDHHDWTSETYVEEWVSRQQVEDPTRAERFQLMCDLFPFPTDAQVTILDVGAGYGPVSKFILDRYPNATCIAQDGSEPMLHRARTLMAGYGRRFTTHQSDLFDTHWLPKPFGPFDAAVSSSCLHNLRDFTRISGIYREIREHLKPGGVFLNLDLLNAPTPELQKWYVAATAARRQREDNMAMVRRPDRSPADRPGGAFPANLDQHLAALKAAGFREVDCFWKDLRRAIYGGYA
ncbi:MAG: class I SAM-dependent methyltransferase [Nitrospinae bacterium]|nr:class I SAM-dependent methyltransferase [Nitrospinota bacterium]